LRLALAQASLSIGRAQHLLLIGRAQHLLLPAGEPPGDGAAISALPSLIDRGPAQLPRAHWRPLHDDEAGPLQMLDQAFGNDRRHEFLGIVGALAALKVQRECERVGDVLGSGRE
jgi:hypothetical protein